jgi:hypothetical protein
VEKHLDKGDDEGDDGGGGTGNKRTRDSDNQAENIAKRPLWLSSSSAFVSRNQHSVRGWQRGRGFGGQGGGGGPNRGGRGWGYN